MLDHISFSVSDYPRTKTFYEKALEPLGFKIMMEMTLEQSGGKEAYAGFGKDHPFFWISAGQKHIPHLHIAFAAPDRATVDAFYKAALTAGGKDNGTPGLRPHYHENYYGAFVRDPDGHNIEAVCHKPVHGG